MNDKNSLKKYKAFLIEDELSFNATDLSEAVKKATGDSKVLSFESVESSGINDSILPTRRSDGVCLKKGERFKDYVKTADSDIDATEVVHNLSYAIKGTCSYTRNLAYSDSSSSGTSIEFVPVRKSRRQRENKRRIQSRDGDPGNHSRGGQIHSQRSLHENCHTQKINENPGANKVDCTTEMSQIANYVQYNREAIIDKSENTIVQSSVCIHRSQFLSAQSSTLIDKTLSNLSSESCELPSVHMQQISKEPSELKKSNVVINEDFIASTSSLNKMKNQSSVRYRRDREILTNSGYDCKNLAPSSTSSASATRRQGTTGSRSLAKSALNPESKTYSTARISSDSDDLPSNVESTEKITSKLTTAARQTRKQGTTGSRSLSKSALNPESKTYSTARISSDSDDLPSNVESTEKITSKLTTAARQTRKQGTTGSRSLSKSALNPESKTYSAARISSDSDDLPSNVESTEKITSRLTTAARQTRRQGTAGSRSLSKSALNPESKTYSTARISSDSDDLPSNVESTEKITSRLTTAARQTRRQGTAGSRSLSKSALNPKSKTYSTARISSDSDDLPSNVESTKKITSSLTTAARQTRRQGTTGSRSLSKSALNPESKTYSAARIVSSDSDDLPSNVESTKKITSRLTTAARQTRRQGTAGSRSLSKSALNPESKTYSAARIVSSDSDDLPSNVESTEKITSKLTTAARQTPRNYWKPIVSSDSDDLPSNVESTEKITSRLTTAARQTRRQGTAGSRSKTYSTARISSDSDDPPSNVESTKKITSRLTTAARQTRRQGTAGSRSLSKSALNPESETYSTARISSDSDDLPSNVESTKKITSRLTTAARQTRRQGSRRSRSLSKSTLNSRSETLVNSRTSRPEVHKSVKNESERPKLYKSKSTRHANVGAQGSSCLHQSTSSFNEPENRRPFDSKERKEEDVISLKSPLRKDSIFRSKDKPPLGRELTADDRDQFETLLPSSHSNLPQFPQSTIYEPAVACAEKETNQRNYLQSTMVAAGCNNQSLAGLLPPLSPISKPGENKDMDEIFKGIGSLYVTGDGDICGDLSLVEVHDTPYGKKLILDPGRSSLYVIEPGKEIYDNDMESKRIVELFSPERLDIRRRGERCSIDRDVHVILIQKGTALMLYNKDECRRAVVKVTISD
ncbi:hypothetical protein ACOME3_001040 [Neoechinorhynchus agilis]